MRFADIIGHGFSLYIFHAHPGQQVIAICGDRGISIMMGDLMTTVK